VQEGRAVPVKDAELRDALNDLHHVVEDLYGVANTLERTRNRKLARRATELSATISSSAKGR
jgi:hypothetical protein